MSTITAEDVGNIRSRIGETHNEQILYDLCDALIDHLRDHEREDNYRMEMKERGLRSV